MTGRRRSALVVDDEVFARLFVTQILLDEGFVPLEAESTVEALDILDTHQDVSVLITDVCMPGDRDGLDLARRVSQVSPRIKIIIVSGQVRPNFVEMPAGASFLAKPYAAHALVSMIRGPG